MIDEIYVKVPLDADLDFGSSVVAYPVISRKYILWHKLRCAGSFTAITAVVLGASWFAAQYALANAFLDSLLPPFHPLMLIIFVPVIWLLCALSSRLSGQKIPCDFVTEKTFYHKGTTIAGDTHAYSLLEKVGPVQETNVLKIGRVPFKPWGNEQEETARIKEPKNFAQVLASFKPTNVAEFPQIEAVSQELATVRKSAA